MCNVDTHEYINDSDEEHIENNNNLLRNIPQQVIITLAEHSASISNNNIYLFFDINIHNGPSAERMRSLPPSQQYLEPIGARINEIFIYITICRCMYVIIKVGSGSRSHQVGAVRVGIKVGSVGSVGIGRSLQARPNHPPLFFPYHREVELGAECCEDRLGGGGGGGSIK